MVLEALKEIKESKSDSFAVNVELSDDGDIQYLVIDNHKLKFKYIDRDKYVFISGINEFNGKKIDREVEIDKSKIDNIENSFPNRFYLKNLYVLDEYTIFTKKSKNLIIFDDTITHLFNDISGLINFIITDYKFYLIDQYKNTFDSISRENKNLYVNKDSKRFSLTMSGSVGKKNNIIYRNGIMIDYEDNSLNNHEADF